MAAGSIIKRLAWRHLRGELKASATALATAAAFQKAASKRLFHIGLIDAAYRAGNLTGAWRISRL